MGLAYPNPPALLPMKIRPIGLPATVRATTAITETYRTRRNKLSYPRQRISKHKFNQRALIEDTSCAPLIKDYCPALGTVRIFPTAPFKVRSPCNRLSPIPLNSLSQLRREGDRRGGLL